MRANRGVWGLLLATLALASGCADAPDASPLATDGAALEGRYQALVGTVATAEAGERVEILRRKTALKHGIRVTATIGIQGGTLPIPEAGIWVVFPAGWLPLEPGESVRVSVSSLPGDRAVYLFEPHGLQFAQPVWIYQDIRKTEAFRNPAQLSALRGAYFPDASFLGTDGTALVQEIRATEVDGIGGMVRFPVDHFSGYLLTSGRSAR